MRWQDNTHSSIRHPSGQSTTDQIADSFANATARHGISACTKAAGLALLLTCTVIPSWAAADAFLDAIKQEVHAVEVDPVTRHSVDGTPQPANKQPTLDQTTSDAAANNKADVPLKMTQAAFEDHLAKHYVGSFSFYRRLTPEKKAEVYSAYTDRPEIKFIREKIKQTYLNR